MKKHRIVLMLREDERVEREREREREKVMTLVLDGKYTLLSFFRYNYNVQT